MGAKLWSGLQHTVFDDAQRSWREMDPDFVAHVKTAAGGHSLYLVIEFKGMKRGEPEEEAKRRYMEKWWCPPCRQMVITACGGESGSRMFPVQDN